MARKKSIETDELLRLITEWHLEQPNEKITIPKIGEYLRAKGYPVQDYSLRRYTEAKDLIEQLNETDGDELDNMVIVFHPLDVEKFIMQNNSLPRIKSALTKRDDYYSKVCADASRLVERNKLLKDENEQLKKKYEDLKAQLEKEELKLEKASIKEKDNIIRELNRIINDYVYPEMANSLLEQQGLLEQINRIISPEGIDSHKMQADTNIAEFKNTEVNDLMKSFED